MRLSIFRRDEKRENMPMEEKEEWGKLLVSSEKVRWKSHGVVGL